MTSWYITFVMLVLALVADAALAHRSRYRHQRVAAMVPPTEQAPPLFIADLALGQHAGAWAAVRPI